VKIRTAVEPPKVEPKPGEPNAIAKGPESKSDFLERQGVDAQRPEAIAGGGNRPVESGQVAPQEKVATPTVEVGGKQLRCSRSNPARSTRSCSVRSA